MRTDFKVSIVIGVLLFIFMFVSACQKTAQERDDAYEAKQKILPILTIPKREVEGVDSITSFYYTIISISNHQFIVFGGRSAIDAVHAPYCRCKIKK